MPVRRPAKLAHSSRRGEAMGPIRKADPTSGATFNVQVVKGKMSGKCLVHACRALTIGLTLMFIGAGMATIGYYTNTHAHELRANGTVAQFRFKNENRGLHLNNLSYLGPIIMGVGGFIVVAACVITFEMRDSAAKVMPARLVVGGQNSSKTGTQPVRRGKSMTKAQWEQQLGVFRASPAEALAERRAQTAALIHFSKNFGSPKPVPMRRMSKSDSVPNIFQAVHSENSRDHSPIIEHCMAEYLAEKHHRRSRRRSRPSNSLVQRSTRDNFLRPSTMMKMHKTAISFDESGVFGCRKDSMTSSPQGSVKFDLTPLVINDQEVYRNQRMKPRRSDTAKRHVLSRQKPIEDELTGVHKYHGQRRRSSALSDSPSHRRSNKMHRQHSSDSRCPVSAEASPSLEQKFRSQISVCSEPPPVLSCQSSIDPVVPEEHTTDAEKSDNEQKTDDNEIDEKSSKSKKLHRSSSTKSYKEKKKLEARKNNEIARLFAIQALKQRLENEHDIEVISERRQKNFVAECNTEPFINSESVTTTTTTTTTKDNTIIQVDDGNETIINIPEQAESEIQTENEVIK
uniref:CSON014781 protein n=1 Tax=Culicoides sonorensis TaxID=179676 RepID=A0A336M0I8_CULSO